MTKRSIIGIEKHKLIAMTTSKVLVVGSGVIGLRTALELLKRNIHVHLVSPCHPLHPSTCSMGAGGLWMPFHIDDTRTDSWASATLSELLKDDKLVEMLPAVAFKRNQDEIPNWATGNALSFQQLSINDLYKESTSQSFRLPRRDVMEDAGYRYAWLFQTPIVNCPKYLVNMLDEIKGHPYTDCVDVETKKYYKTIQEMVHDATKLGCDGVMNCTGLGSKDLCNDNSLVGARGILLHYDRSSCVWMGNEDQQSESVSSAGLKDSVILIEEPPLGSDTHPCYMIPRGNIIAIGGTYLEGDNTAYIRGAEREKIVHNAQSMGIDIQKSKPVSEWVGFRPYRPTSRLELEQIKNGVKVVHSYGYGGSGWTVFAGVARDAASLMAQV